MVNKLAGDREPMPFTLITTAGDMMTFHLESIAELYRKLYGGKITKWTKTEPKQKAVENA